MKKLLVLILAVIPCVFILTACIDKSQIPGTYYFVEFYGEDKTYKVGDTLNGTELTENSAILVLNEDKTATYKDLEYVDEITGKWEEADGVITFTSGILETIAITFEIQEDGILFLVVDDNSVISLSKKE